jgi:DNA recombination protein RmuC
MTDILLIVSILLLLLVLGLLISLFTRKTTTDLTSFQMRFESIEKGQERSDSLIREEFSKSRDETASTAHRDRVELANALKSFSDMLNKQMADNATLLKGQLDTFAQQLGTTTQTNEQKLGILTESIEKKLEALRGIIDARLKQIQEDNAKQLDQMRATVDEKLQGTLEKRLGESFKQVSERLEQVHQGLGEMQALATGVGDLKKVLTNVKARGGWGEVQLEALLDQILSPEQYEKNVHPKEGSGHVVEFAIKLPGGGDGASECVWLPIDAKFPMEDYQRLVDAQEGANLEGVEEAAKFLANSIKNSAKDICEKYICPPNTTDFAVMFLPTEGLYAEVVRRADLVDTLQREYRVVVAGPSTFAALLNSLQMGFRTLAIQERSSEVWKLLGAVKTEFGKFGTILEKVKTKLVQASNTMDDAAKRSRAIERKLRNVEELPVADAKNLLAGSDGEVELEEVA